MVVAPLLLKLRAQTRRQPADVGAQFGEQHVPTHRVTKKKLGKVVHATL